MMRAIFSGLRRAVLLAAGVAAACTGNAGSRRASVEAPGATRRDAGAPVARIPAPTPPQPPGKYPVDAALVSYLEGFREEKIDGTWASEAEAAIRAQLTRLDPNVVRVRLVECRCSACMLGFILAPGAELRDVQPGVDYPSVRWSAFEKHWRGSTSTGWTDGLIFLARHPKDSVSASVRVHSADDPWADPACTGAFPFPPTWDTQQGLKWAGVGGNRMVLAIPSARVCSCICGKVATDGGGRSCFQQSRGRVYCAPMATTSHNVPIIEGEWSCERTAPDASH